MRTLLFLFAVSLALPLLSFPLHADPTTKSFVSSAGQVPRALMDKGYRRIGRIDLAKLQDEMAGVAIVSAPAVRYPVGGDQVRSSAYFHCDRRAKRITVSREMWEATPPKGRTVTAMHEYLGCLGYKDTIYNISNALNLLSLDKTHKILNRRELATIESYIEKHVAARSGGIVGVGGGGDMGGALLKFIILERGLEKMKKARNTAEREQAFDMMYFQLGTGFEFKWKKAK